MYLFTTLLDAEPYTVEKLVELYGLRWHVELNLCYVKDTLDMALLAGKSVDIVRKELHAGVSVTCLGHENGRHQCCSHRRYGDYT